MDPRKIMDWSLILLAPMRLPIPTGGQLKAMGLFFLFCLCLVVYFWIIKRALAKIDVTWVQVRHLFVKKFSLLDEEFLDEMLQEHNKLREIHLSPPLIRNRNMSLQAKALAIQLAAEANLRHSDKASRPDQGENLAMGCTSSGPGITAKDAAKEWYESHEHWVLEPKKSSITWPLKEFDSGQ